MSWLLGSATLWFSGFALLLPVAPLWVIHGGSDWNLSFDAGTGLGAFAAGAIATATSYSAAFAVLAIAVGLVGGCWALPRLAKRGD
jgi:hypothetical protein